MNATYKRLNWGVGKFENKSEEKLQLYIMSHKGFFKAWYALEALIW